MVSERGNENEATRRRSVKRTVVVLAAVAAVIYLGFIGRGIFGIGS